MVAMQDLLPSEAARFDEVCRLGLDRLEPVAQTIAVAFAADPVWNWLLGQPGASDGEGGLALARALVADTSPADETHGFRHHGAVALWRAPHDPDRPAAWKADRAAPFLRAFAEWAGDRLGVIGEFSAALIAARPAEPHWYLSILATEPERQGQGLGSRLLSVMVDRSDRTGVPIYLESSNPRNHALYHRHGFVDGDEISAAGSPPVLAFYRRSRPHSAAVAGHRHG